MARTLSLVLCACSTSFARALRSHGALSFQAAVPHERHAAKASAAKEQLEHSLKDIAALLDTLKKRAQEENQKRQESERWAAEMNGGQAISRLRQDNTAELKGILNMTSKSNPQEDDPEQLEMDVEELVEPKPKDEWALLGSMLFPKTLKLYHLHIPRTAGTSFFFDLERTVTNATMSVVSKEGCYSWKNRIKGVNQVVTFVRNPRSHVLSQFLFCSEGSIHLLTQVHKFRTWIKDWTELVRKGKVNGDYGSRSRNQERQLKYQKFITHSFLPFHCYNPNNLMVQHFTCMGSPFNYTNQSTGAKTEPAIKNMKETFFVGVTEAYQESLCLLYYKLHDKLPVFCDCKNRTAWTSYNSSHMSYYVTKGANHNISSWKPETGLMVDNLTSGDRQLYRAAVNRFVQEVHAVERRFKTTVLCDDKLAEQSRMEDPMQREFSFLVREAQATLKARP